MAHHVAVGQVADHQGIVPAADAPAALVCHGPGAHLRDQVIGGKVLGAGHQHPVLAGVDPLHAAVEEEGDVGIFLRLRDAELAESQLADILPQGTPDLLLGEGHGQGQGLVIGGGADEVRVQGLRVHRVPLREVAGQGPGQLSGPVGAEIHENHAVPGADQALPVADHRLHELVRDARCVAGLDGGHGVGVLDADAAHHGVIAPLHPLPAAVPIHAPEAALHGGDAPAAQFPQGVPELLHIALAAAGGHVAPVQQGVDVDPLQPPAFGHVHGGHDMAQVAVDAAVGDQTQQVEGASLRARPVHRGPVGGVFKKCAVFNGAADAGQVLEHHPARADVGVAHLAVADLSFGKAHVQPGGGEGRVGAGGKQRVQFRGLRLIDGVGLILFAQAEAVQDEQNCGGAHQSS